MPWEVGEGTRFTGIIMKRLTSHVKGGMAGRSACLLLIFVIGLLVTGCGRVGQARSTRRGIEGRAQSTIASGQARSIIVGGQERTFLLYVPAAYDPRTPVPLVLVFHGGRGTGEKMAEQTQFHRLGGSKGFIVVYPDGYNNGWADGRGTTKAERAGINDVVFVKALIDRLTKELSIDETRIYATGVSNGGIFSNRLGCELAERFAAIAPVVGPMAPSVASRCQPTKPISVLGMYGTSDPLIPWEGEEVRGGDRGPILGVQATMDLWGKLNGCRSPYSREHMPVRVHDNTRIWRETYSECRKGVEVILYAIEGGGHAWPPNEPRSKRIAGISSQNIDATQTIWSFFENHPSRHL